jgi:hypothetical protein
MDRVFPVIMLILIWIPNGGSPTFVWEPQEAFSPAPNFFDQSCILSSSRPESKFESTTSIGTTQPILLSFRT